MKKFNILKTNIDLERYTGRVEKGQLILNIKENADLEKAKRIAKKLNIEITTDIKGFSGLILQLDENGLSLISDNMKLYGDYSKMGRRLKQNNLNNEILIHAVKIKGRKDNLVVLDATAGLGEDSILLAAYGYAVNLYENNPIIAELLKDAIDRAKQIPELKEIVDRMKVFEEDSIIAMQNLDYEPDVILLDPMFPKRTKSALIKKKFQILHKIETPCTNEKELLDSAIKANPKKVVIKRPLKGEYLAGVKPNYSIKGKAIRYDCFSFGDGPFL